MCLPQARPLVIIHSTQHTQGVSIKIKQLAVLEPTKRKFAFRVVRNANSQLSYNDGKHGQGVCSHATSNFNKLFCFLFFCFLDFWLMTKTKKNFKLKLKGVKNKMVNFLSINGSLQIRILKSQMTHIPLRWKTCLVAGR
jgi:hypothetical protein